MRRVTIEGFAEIPPVDRDLDHDEVEGVRITTAGALEQAGLGRDDVDFVCSGSCDYVMGRPFSFAMAVDGIGAWPPKAESHVEMDGAWALYEAWVALQCGDIDVALVYAFGRSSLCDVGEVERMVLDPYTLAPLGIDSLSLAALQARSLMEAGASERDFANVVARNLRAAGEAVDVQTLLAAPLVRDPLRAHDGARRTDSTAAIVLRADGVGPAITGIAHAVDAHHPGMRDLTRAPSAAAACAAAGGTRGVEIAELHTPYAHQDLILRRALDLSEAVQINPTGGSFVADTPMVTGLARIGAAARAVREGAGKALAHVTAGPLLQQNLVCVLEAS